MNINDTYKVKIIDCDFNGNGICRINNIVTFIKGVSLNDEVDIKITDIKKRYALGEVINIKNNICPYFYICGGCSFLHKSISEELEIKNKKINTILNDYNVLPIVSTKEYYYRNKIVLHVNNNKLGLFDKDSNRLCEINNCLLVDEEINKVISLINTFDLSNIDEIMIRKSNVNDLLIKIYGFLNDIDLKELIKLDNLKSLYFDNKFIYGDEYIIEEINGIKYTIYPDAFFQVNIDGMIKIYDKVKEYAGNGNKLLDLYCGTGTIGIYLKDNFKEITGIEINKDAIRNANLNKKINNISNINFICNDSKKIIYDNYDVVVVDPPRSGLSKDVINNLKKIKSKKIIYVSCGIDSLKNNLDDLCDMYNVLEITPINMFPRTNHVESIVLLSKVNKPKY